MSRASLDGNSILQPFPTQWPLYVGPDDTFHPDDGTSCAFIGPSAEIPTVDDPLVNLKVLWCVSDAIQTRLAIAVISQSGTLRFGQDGGMGKLTTSDGRVIQLDRAISSSVSGSLLAISYVITAPSLGALTEWVEFTPGLNIGYQSIHPIRVALQSFSSLGLPKATAVVSSVSNILDQGIIIDVPFMFRDTSRTILAIRLNTIVLGSYMNNYNVTIVPLIFGGQYGSGISVLDDQGKQISPLTQSFAVSNQATYAVTNLSFLVLEALPPNRQQLQLIIDKLRIIRDNQTEKPEDEKCFFSLVQMVQDVDTVLNCTLPLPIPNVEIKLESLRQLSVAEQGHTTINFDYRIESKHPNHEFSLILPKFQCNTDALIVLGDEIDNANRSARLHLQALTSNIISLQLQGVEWTVHEIPPISISFD